MPLDGRVSGRRRRPQPETSAAAKSVGAGFITSELKWAGPPRPFLCAVEIKSKLAHQTEAWATTIASQHGKVFVISARR
jgi:hypothetical protein